MALIKLNVVRENILPSAFGGSLGSNSFRSIHLSLSLAFACFLNRFNRLSVSRRQYTSLDST